MASPILVYDDDCSFCTDGARAIARRSDVETVGFGQLTPAIEARLPADYRDCAHLVTDDAVYSCGDAVERAFARTNPAVAGVVSLLRGVPGYPSLREVGYRWVADNRTLYGRLFG